VGRIAVGAIGAAGRDDPERRLLAHHRADLHRRGVRAQQHAPPLAIRPVEIEGVVHRPRRMILRDVERGEIVPVVLDLRTGRDREAQSAKISASSSITWLTG
jgi:hypothetical protein